MSVVSALGHVPGQAWHEKNQKKIDTQKDHRVPQGQLALGRWVCQAIENVPSGDREGF